MVILVALICLNTPFTTVPLIPSFSVVCLVLLLLENDTRMIARQKYENKFLTNLYSTVITPNYKPSESDVFFQFH